MLRDESEIDASAGATSSSESQARGLSPEDLWGTWSVVNALTSLKHHSHPPTAVLIRRKIDALSLPALDTLGILVDLTIAEKHGRLSRHQVGGLAMAVRCFPDDTASEVAHVHACGEVVSAAAVEAARFEQGHILRIGLEHLAAARKHGIPLHPVSTHTYVNALADLQKEEGGSEKAALELLGMEDVHVSEDGCFLSSKGLVAGAAFCIAVMNKLDLPGDICCGSCLQTVSGDDVSICSRCGDHIACKRCLVGGGCARHMNACRRVRTHVRSLAQSLIPHLRESVRRVAVVRLNGSGLIVPMVCTSVASPLIPSSLWESLSRCSALVSLGDLSVHWRLLVAFLADQKGDDQEAIPYEHVYNLQAATVLADTQPKGTARRAPKLLPGERRRLQKEMKATDKRTKDEARASTVAEAIAEANAVLKHQSARPDATSAMLTSVLLKRGGTASPEVVARARAKRDSLKAIERGARKPAKAKREEPNSAGQVRISGDLTNDRFDAALLLQRRVRSWLRCRKKLRRKQRNRAAKRIQSSVRTWLLPLQKACRKGTRRRPSSSSEGADGDGPEPPKPEPPDEPELPKPASTEPANTECAICLDDDAEYAAVPCGHRCLCADCSKTVSECPVCRTKMSAVLRVFV